jgi:hypothetical protein
LFDVSAYGTDLRGRQSISFNYSIEETLQAQDFKRTLGLTDFKGRNLSKLQASTKVAGTYYYEAEALHKAKKLAKGTNVTLRLDPSNAYDKNAIKVMHGNGKHLGFIPKTFASTLAPLMVKGLKTSASVKEVGIRDSKFYLSLNLSYTNIPITSAPPKPTPQASSPRPRTVSKPSARPVRQQQPTRPKTTRNTKPQPGVSRASQIEDEGKSSSWWVGAIVVAGIILLLLAG